MQAQPEIDWIDLSHVQATIKDMKAQAKAPDLLEEQMSAVRSFLK